MGWSSAEVSLRLLVLVASLLSALSALALLLSLLCPWVEFRGYVEGYYTPLGYEMRYSLTGEEVDLPNTSRVRPATITSTVLLAALTAVSMVSLLLGTRRPRVSAGLVLGVASGLVILYGKLTGLIYAAATHDLDVMNIVKGVEITVNTLAGTIVYDGVTYEHTLVYRLVFATPAVKLLLATSVVTSAVAAVAAMDGVAGGGRTSGLLKHTTPAIALTLIVASSVFSYYPVDVAVSPQPPPVTFEPPEPAPACAVYRSARAAVTYTDFENIPAGWVSNGGVWSIVEVQGAKGRALLAYDNNGGLGGASQFYYSTSLAGHPSLWAAVRVGAATGDGFYGLMLGRSPLNRMYSVVLHAAGYVYISSFGVEAPSGWYVLSYAEVPRYSAESWYTLVVEYADRGTHIAITARVYDSTGNLLTEVSASSTSARRFRPAYLGVIIDNAQSHFDDFIISSSDPRHVHFSLTPQWAVEIWDNTGLLVSSATSVSTSLSVWVVHDPVVGTGSNGRIIIKTPDGSVCAVHRVPDTDAILGGDSYVVEVTSTPSTRVWVEVEIGANKTSARVLVNTNQSVLVNIVYLNVSSPVYARLLLADATTEVPVDLDVWIEGVERTTNLTVRYGHPVSFSTNYVLLNYGANNKIVLHIQYPGGARFSVRLEICSLLGGGACSLYPLVLHINTNTSAGTETPCSSANFLSIPYCSSLR